MLASCSLGKCSHHDLYCSLLHMSHGLNTSFPALPSAEVSIEASRPTQAGRGLHFHQLWGQCGKVEATLSLSWEGFMLFCILVASWQCFLSSPGILKYGSENRLLSNSPDSN